jgi:hypothetical protein
MWPNLRYLCRHLLRRIRKTVKFLRIVGFRVTIWNWILSRSATPRTATVGLKMVFKEIKCEAVDRIQLALDRVQWWVLVQTVMHLCVPQNVANILIMWGNIIFSRIAPCRILLLSHEFEWLIVVFGASRFGCSHDPVIECPLRFCAENTDTNVTKVEIIL